MNGCLAGQYRMRAIDVVELSRNKALLWSMPLGKGAVVATGLTLYSVGTRRLLRSPGRRGCWLGLSATRHRCSARMTAITDRNVESSWFVSRQSTFRFDVGQVVGLLGLVLERNYV